MTSTLLKDLEILSCLPGAPGFEEPIRDYLNKELSFQRIDSTIDRLGNLICHIRGTSPEAANNSIHFDAHMDEPAFMVKYIDSRGLIFCAPIGYFVLETIIGQRVRIITDLKAEKEIHGCFCVNSFHNHDKQSNSIEDVWIDVGANSEEIVKSWGIKPGNSIVFDAPFSILNGGRRLLGKAFDDRVGCAILLNVIRSLKTTPPPVDLFFSFSVQEEFLLRGAPVIFNTIKQIYGGIPQISISLDIGTCGLVASGGLHSSPLEMGKGPGIKLRDKSGVSQFSHVTNPILVALMEMIATKHNIPFQYDFLSGCTNADIFASQQCGVYAGGLGFATRNTHSPVEIVDLADLEATSSFVLALILEGNTFKTLL